MKNIKLGFIGAGNLCHYVLQGLLNHGFLPQNIMISNPHHDKLDHFEREFGVAVTVNNVEVLKFSDIITLTVKPNVILSVIHEIKSLLTSKKLLISAAAGIRLTTIQKFIPPEIPICRVMPNLPAKIQKAATALYGPDLNDISRQWVEEIWQAVGITAWVNEEKDIDIVTALAGSGPAYFFLFKESLEKSAQELGLSPELATLFTRQTALGAAYLAQQTTEPLNILREKVTSPQGTTAAAIQVLENQHIREILSDALNAAYKRAVEIGDDLANLI